MRDLFVCHWPQPIDARGEVPHGGPDRLVLDTCLRRVQIALTRAACPATGGADTYAGIAAYRFLLEFITGLHSRIPGEANVLGQFRQAWLRWSASWPVAAAEFATTIDALLRDARCIRSRHLQGVGGSSYGRLLRRLLQPGHKDRVLFVGAGGLAQSVWPYFRQFAAAVWNRRLPGPAVPAWLDVFAPPDGPAAARWADHVVLTTPPDALNDASWQRWLDDAGPISVTHLGQRAAGSFHVANAGSCYHLDTLFALRRQQDNVRSLQIERARHACAEAAAASGPSAATAPRLANA